MPARRALREQRTHPAQRRQRLDRLRPAAFIFIATGARAERPATEAGIERKLVTPVELAALIRSGEFVLQLHIGASLLAGISGYRDLAACQAPGNNRPAKG